MLVVLIQNWIVFIKPLKKFDKTWKSNFYWQKCSYLCELDTWSSDLNTAVTLGKCLFGAVNLTENSNSEKTWKLWLWCELDTWSSDLSTAVTLGEYMFGAVKLTENSEKNLNIVIIVLDLVHAHFFLCQMIRLVYM